MSSPCAAFTAVLYMAPASTESDAEAASRLLSEPLLNHDNNDDDAAASNSTIAPSFLKRLKALSFTTGVLVAVLSQYVLSLVLWNDAIMTQSSHRVVLFSLAWSFATCGMVFCSMLVMVKAVTRSVLADSQAQHSRDWMDASFQMEAHHIIGALLTISSIWIVIDILRVNPSGLVVVGANVWQSVMIVSASLLAYLMLAKCLLGSKAQEYDDSLHEVQDAESRSRSLLNTYQLIAGTLGLLAGLCSQFFLSFILWKKQMTEPLLDNVIVFSIVWSLSTVVVTFCGCLSLRLLTNENGSATTRSGNDDKAFLRMESYYVFFSLIGICLAWILIDIVLDMREQIFPSLLMLSISLVCFSIILQCFPDPSRSAVSLEDEIHVTSLSGSTGTSDKQGAESADIMLV